ncbi:hypothetical protein PV05_07964 [Exophiala xenobiotica]|uniref:Uncharacterized protein n=1 Tax=Exophiala xenobiotica TaxID=348802 RepID=A0A0D2EAD8_9EURO|nr:uncharacterized protein PV05_07964 [Exophiala xenobiotica]KIW52318.1 hypothetical protein PV05_07964 [Exophiala xenobiotica]
MITERFLICPWSAGVSLKICAFSSVMYVPAHGWRSRDARSRVGFMEGSLRPSDSLAGPVSGRGSQTHHTARPRPCWRCVCQRQRHDTLRTTDNRTLRPNIVTEHHMTVYAEYTAISDRARQDPNLEEGSR